MPFSTIFLLALQLAFAVMGVRTLARRVWPGLCAGAGGNDDVADRLVTDVWGPIALIAPMLFLSRRIEYDVSGVGWGPVGGAACLGTLIIALRGIVRVPGPDQAPGFGTLAAWAASGVCLLLLSAAQELSVWVGQLVFALAAVLLWMNTPTVRAVQHASAAGGAGRAGGATGAFAAVLAACGQGIVSLLLPVELLPVSMAVMFGYGAAAGAAAVRLAGPGAVARLAGWTACLGTLLGIGTISLCFLFERTAGIATGREIAPDGYVARGFGCYAWEGTLLALLPVLVLAVPRIPQPVRRTITIPIALGIATMVAWRLATILPPGD